MKRALPFQPRSYRDFLLFEEHYRNSAAGLTQLYLRPAWWAARAWEAVAAWTPGGRRLLGPFPGFALPALFAERAVFYQANHLAFYASGAPVPCPTGCAYFDVELELGAVLGRPLRRDATPAEARAAVAGFCVLNDFSARDGQLAEMRAGFGPQACKAFANALSATVVSADEVWPRLDGRPGDPPLTGRVVLNDVVVAECRVAPADWSWSFAEAIAHASRATQLYPGEFFGSGTLPGGAGIEHARFRVRAGDTVRLEIDGVGHVTNPIVAEEDTGAGKW